MAARTYTTKDRDSADAIAWLHYGRRTGRVVEQLLEANPGLADYGPLIPAGVVVTVPDLPKQPATGGVRLWD